jgi:hypothetical protein
MKKYKLVRFPEEAHLGFKKKSEVLSKIAREEFKRPNVNISLADTLRYFAQKPIYIYNDDLIKFLKDNKRKTRRLTLI